MNKQKTFLYLLLFLCLLLQGCVTYPVVGCFDDYNEVFKGKVHANLFAGTSRIEVEGLQSKVKGKGSSWITYIPPTLSCEGQKGEALLTFNDGRVVKGQFTALSCSTGYGTGADQNGNTFTFTFGMSDKEADKYIERTRKTIVSRPNLPPVYNPKITRKKEGFNSGTGFFVNKNGYFITSFHVIEDAEEVLVIDNQGEEHIAKYITRDPTNDIALLKAELESIPVSVAPYANLSKGDEVFTLGYPLIQIQGQEQKATFGRVNALSGIQDDIRFLQIDVPVQPGNSGGPLINRSGRVVGITNATLNQINTLRESGTLPQNVNYAVKSDYIFPLIRDYVEDSNDMTTFASEDLDISDLVKKIELSVVLVIVK